MKALNEMDLWIDFEDRTIGVNIGKTPQEVEDWVTDRFTSICSSKKELSVEGNLDKYIIKDGKNIMGDVSFTFDKRTGWYYINDIHVKDMGYRGYPSTPAEWFGLFNKEWKNEIPKERIEGLYNYCKSNNTPNAYNYPFGFIFPLYCATYEEDIEKVKELLKLGVNVDTYKEKRVTSLFMAIYRENLELINLFIGAGADVNFSTHLGLTPLWLAACTNNIEIIKILLAHGAKVDVTPQRGESLISYVFNNTSIETVVTLIEGNTHLLSNIEINNIYKVLQKHSNPELFLITLIKNGLDINEQKNVHKKPLLLLAVEDDNLTLVKLFLKYGADKHKVFILSISVPNEFLTEFESSGMLDPQTIVERAKGRGNKEIVECLE